MSTRRPENNGSMRPPRTCLILGSGVGGLALGALLARAGVEVTILEAHPDWLGGWAHSFSTNGYTFTAGPRYLWNFGPGQIGRRFLEKCGLTEQVPMTELNRRGFDHIYVGNEEPVLVPNGWAEYEEVLKARFPAEAAPIRRFFALCRSQFHLIEVLDEERLYLQPWRTVIRRCLGRHPRSTAWLLLHRHFTLQQAFDRFQLSPAVRAVLFGHGGVFGLPPQELSFHAYVAVTLFYHRGCYYPANDMLGFVGALADTVQEHNGRILRNQRVVAAKVMSGRIQHVRTQTGETFAADAVVVNFDPKSFLALLDCQGEMSRPRIPRYKYSRSVSSLFLGVTDSRMLRPSFGNWNIWYMAGPELLTNPYDGGPFDEPKVLYVNCPTFVMSSNHDAPAGHATITAFAPCSYQAWKRAASPVWRDLHTDRLLERIDRRFVPGLRQKISTIHLRTPLDKEQILSAPEGNIYGRPVDARGVWTKIPFKGLLPNLYFTGSYVTFAGIASVIHGACGLYQELTGDPV
jgi:all-trans-retinol 13,14-reductase